MSCHLVTDGPLEELHAFAGRIGIRRAWFQGGKYPHYDLTGRRREAAVRLGAVELDDRAFHAVLKKVTLYATTERGSSDDQRNV